MATKNLNFMAKRLHALHVSGKPLVLTNVYDVLSATAVAALSHCSALATASYAVAGAAGAEDDDMTLEQNINAARSFGIVAANFRKPLTVDVQDGYGDRLTESIRGVIEAGTVGINLEDGDKDTQTMHPINVAVTSMTTAIETAKDHLLPDFVVNARCDTLFTAEACRKSWREARSTWMLEPPRYSCGEKVNEK